MKKTLAESIRSSMSILSEGNLEYALSDLHNESNGNPTQELADEIAAEYGLQGSQLMSAYPQYAEAVKNKMSSQGATDPEKANIKARHDRIEYSKRLDKQRAEQEAELSAKRDSHGDVHAKLEATVQAVTAPEGWTKSISEPEYARWDFGPVLTFLNDAGNIKIVLKSQINDKDSKYAVEDEEFAFNGDTLFKFKDKWFTFTDYSKWGDSFSISRYSPQKTIEELHDVIAEQAARAEAALARKMERGY
jgi:hypothetical protein